MPYQTDAAHVATTGTSDSAMIADVACLTNVYIVAFTITSSVLSSSILGVFRYSIERTKPSKKFDIRLNGFPTESPQFKLKGTKITLAAFEVCR